MSDIPTIEAAAVPEVLPKYKEILTHMLGMGDHVPKSSRGYRNYFCSSFAGESFDALVEMEAAGLVRRGHTINEGKQLYFFATLAGCQAIGMNKKQIELAFKE